LRKLKSDKASEVKLMKAKLETLKTQRDTAMRLKKEISEGQSRVTASEMQIQELEKQIQVGLTVVTDPGLEALDASRKKRIVD
jgi:wobble nucleotide-excising tRNase